VKKGRSTPKPQRQANETKQFESWLQSMPDIPMDGDVEHTLNLQLTLRIEDWLWLARAAIVNKTNIAEILVQCLDHSQSLVELPNKNFRFEPEKDV
jgi:hypothetical protein